ncbi:MAG: insulinase family protein [Acidobacteria bacterium]|nr:insulinase family protein [Acidobacteriota bacterium]
MTETADKVVAAGRPGLATRVRRVEGAPVVAVRLWLNAGTRVEAIPGQGLLAGRMLEEGTLRRDWRQIAADAEGRGMELSSFGAFEGHGVNVDALAPDWELALDWAAELLREPSFPEDRCAWLGKQAAAELEGLADQPDVKSGWAFLEHLYTPHPRCRPVHGTVASLLAVGAADCAVLHRGALAGGVIAAVAGMIDEDAVRRRLESLFADLPPRAQPFAPPAAPAGLAARRHQVQVDSADQAHLYIGHLTVPRRHPDYTALELVAVILGSGAGLTGRIPDRIREREGLAYTAYAQTLAGAGEDPGRLVAYVATSPDTAEQAERGASEEIARLVDHGITDRELEDARSYLLGREPFRRETARQWADLLVEAEQYGLPLDDPYRRIADLRALDRPTCEAAARRHLRPGELRVTIGLPG